jgi:hypothetical protein
MSGLDTDGLSVTYSSDRTGSPDLRLIHYNDVYHVEYASPSLPALWHSSKYFYVEPDLQSPLAVYRGSNHL